MTRSAKCEELIGYLTSQNETNANEQLIKDLVMDLKKDDCARDLLKATINNRTNDDNTTALYHAAAKNWNKDVIEELFDLGASIAGLDKVTIKNIPPEQLERVFDNSWKPCDDEEDQCVLVDYNFLQKTQEKKEDPTRVLLHMTASEEHQTLVTHPVIKAFLWRKWREKKGLYYLNLAIFLAFVVSVIGLNYNMAEMSNELPLESVWPIFASVMTGLLVCWELIQMFFAFNVYKKNISENIKEWLLIFITASNIFWPSAYAQRCIGAVVVVYACILLILLLGKHPELSFLGIHLQVLFKLKLAFLKFILSFGLIVLAFGFGFCLILRETSATSSITNSTLLQADNATLNFTSPASKETEQHDFQKGFFESFFKILAMFVGELDYDALQKTQQNVTFMHVFFALFVCIVVIVLMNFITGLAVENVSKMKSKAKIWYYTNIIETIAYLEALGCQRCKSHQIKKIKLILKPKYGWFTRLAARVPGLDLLFDLEYGFFCFGSKFKEMNAGVLEAKWTTNDIIESFMNEIRRRNTQNSSSDPTLDVAEALKKLHSLTLRMENAATIHDHIAAVASSLQIELSKRPAAN